MQDSDAISFVRCHPEMFRVQSRHPGLGLVAWVIQDALVYGDRSCEVFQIDRWWFVISETDWLLLETPEGVENVDSFSKIIPAPEIGDNGMRSEILLTVYADAVWVITPTRYKMIKGEEIQGEQIKELIANRWLTKNWRRIVAFWV